MAKSDPLLELIELASVAAEKLFRKDGEVHPLWHMVKGDGTHVVSGAPTANKNDAVAIMRVAFHLFDVVRYVFVDEAWMVSAYGSENVAKTSEYVRSHTGISEHPDRREVIIFSAEDRDGRQVIAQREIIRGKGKPRLGPLVIIINPLRDKPGGITEGRMVGLLSPRAGASKH